MASKNSSVIWPADQELFESVSSAGKVYDVGKHYTVSGKLVIHVRSENSTMLLVFVASLITLVLICLTIVNCRKEKLEDGTSVVEDIYLIDEPDAMAQPEHIIVAEPTTPSMLHMMHDDESSIRHQ